MSLFIPKDYRHPLTIQETQVAIKLAKDTFERKLAKNLNLTRVTAPLFVYPESGLNDNLSGVERPVSFDIKATGRTAEIVQSLAKWKRFALVKYGFSPGEGLYTDMNAIRRDEALDNLHSIYVDQWDWEIVITPDQRNLEYLQSLVRKIALTLKETKAVLSAEFPVLHAPVSEDVYFISAEELRIRYPHLSPKEREDAICREHGTVFISGIGHRLGDGKPHDLRAPDYDDWSLNGDILLWYPPLNQAVELTSMGIRVDSHALRRQCALAGTEERLEMPYHCDVLYGRLPLTAGGGIGQSRVCLVLLEKVHIGEVQASLWPEEHLQILREKNINIL